MPTTTVIINRNPAAPNYAVKSALAFLADMVHAELPFTGSDVDITYTMDIGPQDQEWLRWWVDEASSADGAYLMWVLTTTPDEYGHPFTEGCWVDREGFTYHSEAGQLDPCQDACAPDRLNAMPWLRPRGPAVTKFMGPLYSSLAG